jgi:hypothetical protein
MRGLVDAGGEMISGEDVADFPIFRVEGWNGDVSRSGTTHSSRTLYDKRSGSPIARTREVLLSCTVSHQRRPDNGEFVVVTSARPDGEAEIEWHYPISNILASVIRDEFGDKAPDGEWERRCAAFGERIADGRIPTTGVMISVDGIGTEFQIVNIGEYSAAGALLDTGMVQMWSRLVTFHDLGLVDEAEYRET